MPLRVQCSAGHLMMVPDHRAGTVLRCPNCGIDVQVPAAPGAPLKDAVKPRISTPVLAGKDAKPGLGSPLLNKPKPPVLAEIKNPILAEAKKPVVADAKKPPPPEPGVLHPAAVVEPPVVEPLVIPPPIAAPPFAAAPPLVPEVVFITPVVETPALLAKATEPVREPPLVIDQSTIETVELPPKSAPAQKESSSEPAPTQSGYARQRESESKRQEPPRRSDTVKTTERLFEIKDETPAVTTRPAPKPVFASAATVIEAEVLADRPVAAAEPAPLPQYIAQGPQPTASQRHAVWQLAAALSAAMLLSIGPSLWEFTDYLRSEGGLAVARWAFLLLLLGVMQLGSIVLLLQVPDWSSVWIVTLQSLALAALYAALLGLTVITGGDSSLVSTLHLDQQYNTGKAPPWCICLAATYACLAFFAGRFSAKWRKIHRQIEATERAAAY